MAKGRHAFTGIAIVTRISPPPMFTAYVRVYTHFFVATSDRAVGQMISQAIYKLCDAAPMVVR